jgi:membrane-associated phospholipid phosphatase
MTKAVPEQKRQINHQARGRGGPDPEADHGASGTQVEDAQSAVRPGDSRNAPSRRSGETFLAHPAHVLWAAGGMLALVVLIAILVPAGPLGLDRSWSEAMHHLETPQLTDLALVFNWLGRGVGRALALTLVGLLLLCRRRWLALVAFAVAESLAPLLSALLKALVDRARPPDGLVHPVGASFPSGHATYAGATCVALVLLFTTPGTRRRAWWALAILGVVGMAWSRTYLQVHWLTDVVAGALLGSAVSLLVFAITQRHERAATSSTLHDAIRLIRERGQNPQDVTRGLLVPTLLSLSTLTRSKKNSSGESLLVRSCGPSGSQDLAFRGDRPRA